MSDPTPPKEDDLLIAKSNLTIGELADILVNVLFGPLKDRIEALEAKVSKSSEGER
jgi:hypothetical protein